MRSRSDNTRSMIAPPAPAPARSRRTSSRGTPSSRRRSRLITEPVPAGDDLLALAASSPVALYRAEKARRAANVDAVAMAEAKRLYDEAVAETGKQRAGMRSRVTEGRQHA